ncbi:uncharacterized protein LOC117808509 [Xyrichtys novacula]|uniref:Uncharacterized protein LOC117808509 n=1 Tax=Xyrichtys novacula TaxID=13765 RepID=A0AAV1GVC8_XYRNO|nr:uncharacterized protein LOC117808509 [Xyrichtys novacula]
MSIPRTPERMEQKFYLASKETVKPVIRMFLGQLTAQNWQRLETGRLDQDTSTRLTDLAVDIIEILAKILHGSLNARLEIQQDPSPGSVQSVCKEDVHKCLGNTGEVITQTVAEIQGVGDIHYPECGQVTELMVTAVTEKVNSRLSKTSDSDDSEEHKTPYTHLIKLTKHFQKILKYCSKKMKKMLAKAEQEFKKFKSACTVQEKEEVVVSTQTSVTSLQEEKPGKAESSVNKHLSILQATKEILEKQLEEIANDFQSHSTEEKDSLLLSTTSKDSELSELSFQIVDAFTNEARKDLLEEKQSSTKETSRHNRRRLINRMKSVFVRTVARESIMNMMSAVRRKQACQGQEVVELDTSQLIKSVDNLLTEAITPKDQDTRSGSREVCLFQKIASDISNGTLESFAEKLSDTLANHLTPLEEETHREEIRTEVDNVIKQMWNWLKKQILLRKTRKDSVSMTLREVKKVVLNEHSGLSSPKTEAEDQTYPTPVQEEVQSVTAEEAEEEACNAGEEKKEACADEEEEEEAFSDGEEKEEACVDEEDEEEAFTAEEQVEQVQVAKASGEYTESVLRKWDLLTCEVIVRLFLRKVTKDFFPDLIYKSVEARLRDLLFEKMIGTDVNVDLSLKSMQKKCKAVYKELCKKFDGTVLLRSLLEQDQPVVEAVVEALKEHFSSERPSGIQKFFRCLVLPFTVLLVVTNHISQIGPTVRQVVNEVLDG